MLWQRNMNPRIGPAMARNSWMVLLSDQKAARVSIKTERESHTRRHVMQIKEQRTLDFCLILSNIKPQCDVAVLLYFIHYNSI